ncbi:amidohydrolase family protein [Colwellia sp. BRX10-4]|uniref:amidohydrolase family protein n=1 Tax=Colwellia sp. BRX10-4 TaxID=2759843 RepID=UPI0015F7564A|nr:amidohydrolase family protein [Colwellia sp. BRX10-4]MBA6399050.1 amidohydrolase family protein [Colwellia sp. BRX10-4]
MATNNAADLMVMSKRLRTLEVGKVADIITMNASPFVDINELLAVDFVMKSDDMVKSK